MPPVNSAASQNANSRGSKLALEDILWDLDHLPSSSSAAAVAATPHNDTLLPAEPDDVETSLAISLRLIEASKALLAQADVLDDVQKRMQESEAGLKDVRERLLQD
jgi:hypothetical protein